MIFIMLILLFADPFYKRESELKFNEAAIVPPPMY